MSTETITLAGVRHATTSTSVGELTLVADRDALSGVYFEHHWHRPSLEAFGAQTDVRTDPVLQQAAVQIEEFLSGRRHEFDVPTAAAGTSFQHRVWALIADIPYGMTRTYGDLASDLGQPGHAREVGSAVGRNPLSLVVPCHRVVGKDGKLTGYAGGLERKKFLLRLEEPAAVIGGRLF